MYEYLSDIDGDEVRVYDVSRACVGISIRNEDSQAAAHLDDETVDRLIDLLQKSRYPSDPELSDEAKSALADDAPSPAPFESGGSVSEAEYDGQAIITHVHGDLILNVTGGDNE